MKAEDILSEVLRRYEEALKKHGKSAKTHAEAQALSGRLGKDLGRILAEELLKAFPAGAVPEDVAMGVIPAALRRNSDIVSGFVREIQKRLNEAARVPTPPESRFRYERAANLARWVSKQESFADHETIFSQYVEQNSRMTVDDAVRDQVKAHYGMGLSPKIIRKAAPGCCDWCTKHAGTVDYSKGMDKEIFRRHKNCPCLIEYDPGDGAKRTVNNYRFSNSVSREEKQKRIEVASAALGETRWESISPRSTQPIQRGFSIFPQNEIIAENVKKVKPFENFFDVAGHGSATGMGFGTRSENINARDLARLIRKHPAYNPGTPIRLLSCLTGHPLPNGEYCFAEDLSNALGVPVRAPIDDLRISVDGSLNVFGYLTDDGWKTYTPNERRRM